MTLFQPDSPERAKPSLSSSSITPQQPTPPLAPTAHPTNYTQPSTASHDGGLHFDELSSTGSSHGQGSGSGMAQLQRLADDEDDSEDDVPLTQSYAQLNSANPAAASTSLAQSGSGPGPSTALRVSRKRGRTSEFAYPYDGSIREAVEFLEIEQPRYTLTKRSGTKDDPHVITLKFGVTDGVAARLPAEGTPHINEGTLCAAPPGLNETWCYSIGSRVARLLGLPLSGKDEDTYRLAALPARYALYQNIKTSYPPRKDPYLWGPPRTGSIRYRSGPELAPHVYWLLTAGTTEDGARLCECKYCTSAKSQIAINQKLGLQDSQVFHRAERHYIHRAKPNAPRKPKQRAASPPVNYLGPFTNALRDQDLAERAPAFRQSELVWVELDQALVYPTGEEDYMITHWPGLVCARELRMRGGAVAGVGTTGQADAPTLEAIEQRHVYRVQLLALEDVALVEEWSLGPWMSLSAAALNYTDFHVPHSAGLVFDGTEVLVPRLKDFEGDSQKAMVAFALAIQVSANVDIKFAVCSPFLSPGEAVKVEAGGRVRAEGTVEYESVWWGAELVHSEELVRVLVSAKEAEASSNAVGPGKLEHAGILLKLAAIFHSPVAGDGEPVLQMAGTLLALVRNDPAQAARPRIKKEDGADDSVNGDDLADLHLPPPPAGYAFRRLTARGQQAVFELENLAGRYYPLPERLQGHADRIEEVLRGFVELQRRAYEAESIEEDVETNFTEDQLALILGAVLPARYKFGQARFWAEDRFKMIVQAEATTNEEAQAYLNSLAEGQVMEGEGEGEGEQVVAEGGMEVA